MRLGTAAFFLRGLTSFCHAGNALTYAVPRRGASTQVTAWPETVGRSTNCDRVPIVVLFAHGARLFL